ncbi:Cupin domain protein [Halopelagius inordinatus]|uniref:Cupin domain protein n=1 Tax=Halopelagius inordinatus TaxID=553467 RepID=A0A1I2SDK0_9EURY|nr:cupin domain-containing protein [Halopelagius inordinatus]SFG49027.1 Cupin domain protein [Halopelagius inordinatus]
MERVSTDDVESVEPVSGVGLSVLARTEGMNVQRFAIEPGATVPTHSHEQEQVGYVVSGELTFLVGDGEDPTEVVVREGDSFALAAHETHGAENRGDVTVEGVDIFSPPRIAADWGDE